MWEEELVPPLLPRDAMVSLGQKYIGVFQVSALTKLGIIDIVLFLL